MSHEYTVQQFFVCFVAVMWGSQSAAAIFSYAPDMGNAKQAANHLKALLDRTPPIDSWSREGNLIPPTGLQGTIEFKSVHFAYPLRPEQPVLKGINLIANPGQFVALVGASGSGKSTAIALLERFYDPDSHSGGILVDGQDISTYNLQDYRSHLALVSQETTLYMGTIKDNVLADKTDVSEEAVVKACKDANIYEFIVRCLLSPASYHFTHLSTADVPPRWIQHLCRHKGQSPFWGSETTHRHRKSTPQRSKNLVGRRHFSMLLIFSFTSNTSPLYMYQVRSFTFIVSNTLLSSQ